MSILYVGGKERGDHWRGLFAAQCPELRVYFWPDIDSDTLNSIRYLIAWRTPPNLIEQLPHLQVVFSVGAGVDQIQVSDLPEHIELVRMIEPGIVSGMVEYVTWAVLTLHRHIPDYLQHQKKGRWEALDWVPSRQRRVGIMGLGSLGQAVAQSLAAFDFPLYGWARSHRDIPGVHCFAGSDELNGFLSHCDILICLLPLTDETRGILNEKLFRSLPRGAAIVNAARGGHLCPGDLLRALDQGQLRAAILDVTDPEPLPPEHPFWSHEGILITPHVAAVTQTGSAGEALVANVVRHRAGESMTGVVDRQRGY